MTGKRERNSQVKIEMAIKHTVSRSAAASINRRGNNNGQNEPDRRYPILSWTLGSQHWPSVSGSHNFSSGWHWRLTVREKVRLTTAMRMIKAPRRMRQWRELPSRRMKKRQMEILASVAPIMNQGWPKTSNSRAFAESGVELSNTLKMVPVNATS